MASLGAYWPQHTAFWRFYTSTTDAELQDVVELNNGVTNWEHDLWPQPRGLLSRKDEIVICKSEFSSPAIQVMSALSLRKFEVQVSSRVLNFVHLKLKRPQGRVQCQTCEGLTLGAATIHRQCLRPKAPMVLLVVNYVVGLWFLNDGTSHEYTHSRTGDIKWSAFGIQGVSVAYINGLNGYRDIMIWTEQEKRENTSAAW